MNFFFCIDRKRVGPVYLDRAHKVAGQNGELIRSIFILACFCLTQSDLRLIG